MNTKLLLLLLFIIVFVACPCHAPMVTGDGKQYSQKGTKNQNVATLGTNEDNETQLCIHIYDNYVKRIFCNRNIFLHKDTHMQTHIHSISRFSRI